jgi:hypothetical protein
MIKSLVLTLLAASGAFSAAAVRLPPLVPVEAPPPPPVSVVLGNDSRTWSHSNQCQLCKVVADFIEAHEDVICAKEDKKCAEFITDEFDDVICKILCETELRKKWFDIL